MKAATVRLRVLRPLVLRGDHISAGREIDVAALDAQLLLESTRAELVNPAEFSVVRAAVHGQTSAILRQERLGRFQSTSQPDQ